jgi:cytochrome c-type biogenesis protein CcmH/formate-dependent nitrite reductase complex subunit NrfF
MLFRWLWRIALLLLIALPLRAEIVDTWQFRTEQNQQRAITLAKQLRCPQCQNQNLVESTSPIARDLRLEVYRMVDEGKTDDEIITLMTSRFGDFVLYKPRFNGQTVLLWLSPLILLLIAALALWRYFRVRQLPPPEISAEQKRRLAALLETLEKKP